jgi:hypothetical protein
VSDDPLPHSRCRNPQTPTSTPTRCATRSVYPGAAQQVFLRAAFTFSPFTMAMAKFTYGSMAGESSRSFSTRFGPQILYWHVLRRGIVIFVHEGYSKCLYFRT